MSDQTEPLKEGKASEESQVQSLKKGAHVPALDGIRGLAILLVLMTHSNGTGPSDAHGLWKIPAVVFEGGWIGVDLFFVLSGFLITGILYDSLGKENYFKNFYARRTLRIFPLYYITTFVSLFLFGPFVLSLRPSAGTVEAVNYAREHGWAFWFYLQNFLPFIVPNHVDEHMLSHYWSLAVEEHFYLFWPLCVYLLRKRILWLSAILFVFSFALRMYLLDHAGTIFPGSEPERMQHAVYQFTFTRLEGLVLGSFIAAYLRQNYKLKLDSLVVPGMVISGLAIVLIAVKEGRFYNIVPLNAKFGFTLLPIFFGCVLLKSLQTQSWLHRFFSLKFLRELGKYSYGMYMTHRIFLSFFAPLWTQKIGTNFAWQVIYFPIVLVVSLAIAKVVFAVIEKPFLNMKGRFSNTYSKAAA